ncbi:MAG: DUF1778 domain-containing protein [Propionibacteriaceae bacterium]|jgi:uncharacterized protein (DUF1778 family)|nr:DUF1778 domain-containing protein [Propionibacteriaceae bacterium]
MTDRLQVRVSSDAKRQLEEAASLEGLTVSSFVLQAAQSRAEQVLAERSLIQLTGLQAEAFLAAMARPAEVNKRLRRTLAAPRRFEWID